MFCSLGHELAESLGNKGGGLLAGRLGSGVGKDDPNKLRELDEKYYRPYGAVLGRAPKGRKGYQERAERSHRTDDEEFYIPLLLPINNEKDLALRREMDILLQRKKAALRQEYEWKTTLTETKGVGL